MTQSQTQTIFALSSAAGRAGVAVVRMTGPQTANVIAALVGRAPTPRLAGLRALRDPETQTTIDRGLVLWFPAPASFTGEDCAEFHVHSGPAVIRALLTTLANQSRCRLAEPGEFSRRAFANGKMDLAEAEGIADLIDAETEAQRQQALNQASGALSALYEGWRARLIEAAALTEAAIDFSDEQDVASDALDKARQAIMQVLPEIQAHLDDHHRGEILRDGFRVVLAGAPNVGKSSLLNALARRDAAIVSEHAGTTRDVVEVRLNLKGYPVIVSDTAGLRAAAESIEQEGIRRAKDAARKAQLVLWLLDHDDHGEAPPIDLIDDESALVRVRSKADLYSGAPETNADIIVSAKTGAGLDQLIALIADRAETSLGTKTSAPALTQVRHRQAVTQCADHLRAYLAGPLADAELRAEDLRSAITALGRITGRVDVEDILDQVFGRFCIGK